ncbi:PREDICTED: histone-lysine N-methyltransferase, H3 lysine-79 specific-like [Amphimedon queenslandica]|uniref:Actin interacting protein 3 C-terminal domain-containing protein n=1 Tax=Amphimedon queenslandica TaxID=400682 RepID=A0A1X7VLZ1_AMPQE|nr:PREDICTED: histone-lysine N-methyltransferase, H3 lysine-79 specific-like [Amphimedon queenslandica]|eukprot:XP_011409823.1 PREDICTED: histone-lysine N-methyltransferase, H3 lysine-79 specific-like [Amphimedon queenslandica]
MPEFRLRRAKKEKGGGQRRRHTLHTDSEMSQQLEEAAKIFNEQTKIILGPNEISLDDAIQGMRVGVRDGPKPPDVFINSTSSSEPPVKAVTNRRISSKYSECIYLRYGADMRRCPLPSPITLSTIKQLFINLFDLSPSVNKDPKWHLFLLNRSNTWKPLTNVSNVSDQSTILLVDSSDLETGPLLNSTPPLVHRSSTGTPDADLSSDDEREDLNISLQNPISSLSQAHSNVPGVENLSSAIYLNGPTNDTHVNETDGLATTQTRDVDVILPPPIIPIDEPVTISGLQKEISFLKRKHQLEIQELRTELTLARLSAAQGSTANNFSVELSQFRKDRLIVEPLKEDYLKESDSALSEMSLLQSIGDSLKSDAIHHQSRIDTDEVNYLLSLTEESAERFENLKGQYNVLEPKLKAVMQKELEVIVAEEQIMKEEAKKLAAATEACKILKETFTTLQQLSGLQAQRPLQVPVIVTSSDPKVDHSSLIAIINSVIPNHQERLEAIKETEMIMRKRKMDLSPTKRALKKFELSLRQRQKVLNPTGRVVVLEKEREEKLRSLYIAEKQERQREIERDLEIAQKALKEKRKKEIAEIEQRLGIDFKISHKNEEREGGNRRTSIEVDQEKRLEEEKKRIEEERKRLSNIELQRLREEKKRLENEKRSQEEERERLDQLRREQEEQQRRLREEQRRQEDEQRRIELQRFQQEQERRQIEEDKRHWKDYQGRLGSESPETRNKRKEMLWQHVQRQIQLEEEKEKSDLVMKRKAHTLKNNYSSQPESSYNNHSHSHSLGHFNEVDNIETLPLAIPPVSLTSRSHKDLRHNRTDDEPGSGELMRKHMSGSGGTQQPNGLIQRGGALGGLVHDDLMPKFSSEDSLIKQNLYDSPWTSKKLFLQSQGGGVSNRRGSASQVHHKRNKSDFNETPPIAPKQSQRDDRSSPILIHPLRTTIGKSKSNDFGCSPSIQRSSNSKSDHDLQETSKLTNHHSPPPLPPPPVSYASPTNPQLPSFTAVAPPPYSQVAIPPPSIATAGSFDYKKGGLLSERMTHYPMMPSGQQQDSMLSKFKPSISLV